MRLIPSVRLAILTAALTATACDLGTSDGVGGTAKVAFTLPLSFASSTVAGQRVENGGEIDRIDVLIVVKSTGEVALRKSVREGDPELSGTGDDETDPVLTVRFRVPDGGEAETFTLTLEGFLGTTKNFTIGPLDFQLSADGRAATVQGQAVYVGPGSNVTGVLLAPRTITVGVNQTMPFSCVGTPGNVTDFPYVVETTNSLIAQVTSTTAIRGGTPGTTELVCRLSFGSRAEDRIPVTVVASGAPSLTVFSGGGQSGLPSAQLTNPIVVLAKNGDGSFAAGVTIQFTPHVGNGTAAPTSAVTNSQGQAQTLWTLGAGQGTQTLVASGTVQGSGLTLNITATASGSGVGTGIQGTVLHGATPVGGATVEVRSGPDNTTGTQAAAAITTPANGTFLFSGLTPGVYTLRTVATGFVTDVRNVTVTSGALTTANPSLAPGGTVNGAVTNGSTNLPLANATVVIRSGTNVTTGTILGTALTGANGTYVFTLAPGAYTLQATATGFTSATANVTLVQSQSVNAPPLSLNPPLPNGQVRILLTWVTLLDLDSHTFVPTSPNTTIVYWNSIYRVDTGCVVTTSPFACLETDAVPPGDPASESTRIGTVITPGVYQFKVHNYTADASNQLTNTLATSGAKVEVFIGSAPTASSTFTVPAGNGNLWTVFNVQLVNGNIQITPVNTIEEVNLVAGPPSGGPPVGAGLPAGKVSVVWPGKDR